MENKSKTKILGPSKYANSKKKKKPAKVQQKDPKISKQNSALKSKIKNLQKEISRLEKEDQDNQDKKILLQKLKRLSELADNFKDNQKRD